MQPGRLDAARSARSGGASRETSHGSWRRPQYVTGVEIFVDGGINVR